MSTGQPPANAPGDDDSVRPAREPLSGILDAERAPDEEVPPAADADEAFGATKTNANDTDDGAPTSRQPAGAGGAARPRRQVGGSRTAGRL